MNLLTERFGLIRRHVEERSEFRGSLSKQFRCKICTKFRILTVLQRFDGSVQSIFGARKLGRIQVKKIPRIRAFNKRLVKLRHGPFQAINGSSCVLHYEVPFLVALSGKPHLLAHFVDIVAILRNIICRIYESLARCCSRRGRSGHGGAYDCRRCFKPFCERLTKALA